MTDATVALSTVAAGAAASPLPHADVIGSPVTVTAVATVRDPVVGATPAGLIAVSAVARVAAVPPITHVDLTGTPLTVRTKGKAQQPTIVRTSAAFARPVTVVANATVWDGFLTDADATVEALAVSAVASVGEAYVETPSLQRMRPATVAATAYVPQPSVTGASTPLPFGVMISFSPAAAVYVLRDGVLLPHRIEL